MKTRHRIGIVAVVILIGGAALEASVPNTQPVVTPKPVSVSPTLRQRLSRLERSPYFQRPPVSFDPIRMLALEQMTDEQLELLMLVARDREAGVCRTLSQSESEAVAASRAALDLIRAGDRR